MIFVIDTNKQPLDMCHPAKARKLLKEGKASVWRKSPFTIILKREITDVPTTEKTQISNVSESSVSKVYALKIDYGSRHTGLAILKGNKVCWLGQLEHRTDIKTRMDKRRGYRRRRRNANLRYRKPRFLNRTRPEGWLPPSLRSRVNNIHTFITRLQKIVPLASIIYENVKFDTQLMEKPDICGIEYQQGELAGYEIREYLLEKFNHKCAYCGVTDVPFEIEHIIPKSRGGSNRISNLTIACHKCNQSKDSKTATEFGYPEVQAQAKKPLKDAAIVNSTRKELHRIICSFGLPVEFGSGGLTKFNRTTLGLPKEHYYDAVCVGKSTPNNLYFATDSIQIIKAIGRGQHQRTNVNASGFPRGYLARQKNFFGFQTGDIVKAIVPRGKKAGSYYGRVACRKTGSFDIKTTNGRIQAINYKCFQAIQKANGYYYNTKRRHSTSSP